uniref:Nucleic-acid-binding protein n=1 Tax=Sipha flava TaxID=143950 RepID=A0A2S2QZZ9_9HEMI
MPADSRTKPDKTVTPIKIKNNQIISRNSGNSTKTEPNKRSLPSSPTTPTLHNVSKKKPKLFNNRYNVLSDLDDNGENIDVHGSPGQEPTDTTAHTFVKEVLPPPIFIKGVKNFTDLLSEITNLIERNSFICKSSSTYLKIQTEKPEDYRTLIRFLKENDAEFHTYQLQSEKPYRVVIRNLHPTTSVSEISSAIEEIGFATRQVTNIRHNLTKNPLPLFFC